MRRARIVDPPRFDVVLAGRKRVDSKSTQVICDRLSRDNSFPSVWSEADAKGRHSAARCRFAGHGEQTPFDCRAAFGHDCELGTLTVANLNHWIATSLNESVLIDCDRVGAWFESTEIEPALSIGVSGAGSASFSTSDHSRPSNRN